MNPHSRHDFVWLDERLPEMRMEGDVSYMEIARAWFAADQPAVVGRRLSQTPSGYVRLGIPLPPSRGKLRIAVEVPCESIRQSCQPPTLDAVIDTVPEQWQSPLRKLAMEALENELQFQVYGSVAWQYLTGENYVTAQSDIDLLWRADSLEEVSKGLEMLLRWESSSGLKADGELLFGDGYAIAWRELLTTSREVLVKSRSSVELKPRSGLLGMFPLRCAT